jgi:hypothetical protein
MAKGSFILPLLPEEIDFEVNSVVEGQVLNTAPTGVILLDTDLNPIVPVSITQLTNQFEIIIATGSIVPSSIEINGVFFKSVNPGDTLNIDIENSLSVAVGTPDSINNRVDISDATLVIEKSDFTTIATINIAAEDLDYYQVPDSIIENSDASYTANVKATDPLTLPDQTIKVNTVTEGAISSVGDIDFNITDGVNPVTPNSVGIVGRTVTVEVPSGGGSPSGVQFQFPIPIQRTSYRTGDEGWRVQNGWYDYTPPAMPKSVAELDYTSTNWADTLAIPLIVNGVSSTNRFVDAFGAKIAGSASVVIDKLQGVAFTRSTINKANWNAAIDDALTYSVTVNSITFADWYLIGLNDILPTTRMEAGVGFAQLIDLSAQLFIFSNNVYTSTTNPANTAQMWHVVFSSRNYTAIDKTFGISAIYVHDARNLITAP